MTRIFTSAEVEVTIMGPISPALTRDVKQEHLLSIQEHCLFLVVAVWNLILVDAVNISIANMLFGYIQSICAIF